MCRHWRVDSKSLLDPKGNNRVMIAKSNRARFSNHLEVQVCPLAVGVGSRGVFYYGPSHCRTAYCYVVTSWGKCSLMLAPIWRRRWKETIFSPAPLLRRSRWPPHLVRAAHLSIDISQYIQVYYTQACGNKTAVGEREGSQKWPFRIYILYWSLLVGQVMNSLLTRSLTHDQLPFMNSPLVGWCALVSFTFLPFEWRTISWLYYQCLLSFLSFLEAIYYYLLEKVYHPCDRKVFNGSYSRSGQTSRFLNMNSPPWHFFFQQNG